MKRHLAPAMLGVFAGIDNLGSGIAFATLLFPAAIASGLGMGVGVILLSAAVLALVLAWRSTCPNTVPLVQETSIAILASAIGGVLVSMADQSVDQRIATVIAILGVSTVVTGSLFWLFGWLRLGVLVRYLPYPVVAGFLAGSGWLLIEGALMMLTGTHHLVEGLPRLLDPLVMAKAAPAVLFAVALAAALRRWTHPMAASGMMVGAGVLFYGCLALAGLTPDQARHWDWLPVVPGGGAVSLPTPEWVVTLADWSAVLQVVPAMISAALLSMVGVLLNLSGLELARGQEIDTNAELRATGLANVLAGGVGGASGYVGLGVTLLAEKMGATGRSAGLATACVILIGLVSASWLASSMPYFLSAGLMMFLGLELLLVWAVEARHKLPRREWLIIPAIVLAIMVTGFLTGLALGLAISVVMFVYTYSRQPVIRVSASGLELRSTVDRAAADGQALDRLGEQVFVIRLQGYLFFGTVERVVARVRERLRQSRTSSSTTGTASLRFLVLDFRHVSGVDSAATSGLAKLCGMVAAEEAEILLCHVTDEVQATLRVSGLRLPHLDVGCEDGIRLMPDLDHGLEYCEETLLRDVACGVGRVLQGVEYLQSLIGDHPRLPDLVAAMESRTLAPGVPLIRRGDAADDVYLLGQGRVRVQVTMPDGRILRLRTMTEGAIVGEVALYRGGARTADVIVEAPSTVYCLSKSKLLDLEQTDSVLAVLFHRVMAATLADKLTLANRQIQLSQH